MSRKAALIGFLIVQAIAVILWVMASQPFWGEGVSGASQIWSGRGYSDLSTNFRSGSSVVLAQPFQPQGFLMWATLLMAGAGAAAIASLHFFKSGPTWLAIGLAALALALGAGGNAMIAAQWVSGDTSFPPGFLNVYLLYALNQAFNIQFFIGFGLLALCVVLVIAGIATKERSLGFHVVALNWAVVAAVWVVSYLALYLAPALAAGPST